MTTNNNEDEISTYLASSEQDIQSIKHGTISTDNHDEHHVTTVDVKSTNTSVSVQKRNFSCFGFLFVSQYQLIRSR